MAKFFESWKLAAGWTVVSATVAAIIMLSNVISAVPTIEPFAPSSRGYVRQLIERAAAQAADYQKKIDESLTNNTVGILDLKLVAINGQIDSLNNQLNEINLKLADPQGADRDLLTTLRKTITDQIGAKQKEVGNAACDKQLAEFPNTTCTRP